MQNKTPIVVLTGLGIVAAAAVAGLTRDQWMGSKPAVVATAPATPEAPKAPEQPAATPEAPKTPEQSAATTTAEQPAATTTAEQPAASSAPAATPVAPKVPEFDTVRVEKTGEAVIAGTATPGADVIVKLDGKVIGQTTANEDGAFVLVPSSPLPVGSGSLTLEARLKDGSETITSPQTVAVIVPAADKPQQALVAVMSPDQPTRVLQKPAAAQPAPAAPAAETPAKLVSIDAVDYDPAGNIVFSGQGEPGNTARVYIDNAFLGDAPVAADGRWSYSGTAEVAPGVHTLRVDGLDAAGKVLNRVEVPFVREQQNKVAEATPPAAPAQPEPATTTTTTTTTAEQPAAATAAEQPASTAPVKPREGRVVIQPGNNLWRIARVLYGDGSRFTELYEANKDLIRDPNMIYPGQVFVTPGAAPAAESIDPKRREPLKPEENAGSGQ